MTIIYLRKNVTKKIIIIKSDEDEDEDENEDEGEKIIIRKSENAGSMGKVKVFPNPTDNQITVQFKGNNSPTTVTVRDVTGKEIFKEELNDFGGDYDKKIDVSRAAAGLLVVTISQGDEVFNVKVLKN